jgi:thiol-disulfide isomerase/thioredoxin
MSKVNLFLIVAVLFAPVLATANEEKPKKDGHGGETVEAPPAKIGPQNKYNPGPVTEFPQEIGGVDLFTGQKFSLKTQKGKSILAIFIASWCVPCQTVTPELKTITEKYKDAYVDYVYIFSHDTKQDAIGFAKEHKLTGRMTLATHEILKAFKNPELPAIYVSDRYKYFGNRYLKATSSDLVSLSAYLSKLTAL